MYVLTIMLYWLISAVPSLCFKSHDSPRELPKETLENIKTKPAIMDKIEIMLDALNIAI